MAADIDPRHHGYEAWGGPGGLRDSQGNEIGPKPLSSGFVIWWDGDLLRELLARSAINKWNWQAGTEEMIFDTRTRGGRRSPNLTQLSQLGDENTILKNFFLHSVSLFPKILSNLAW